MASEIGTETDTCDLEWRDAAPPFFHTVVVRTGWFLGHRCDVAGFLFVAFTMSANSHYYSVQLALGDGSFALVHRRMVGVFYYIPSCVGNCSANLPF